jgi:hypothetical protein
MIRSFLSLSVYGLGLCLLAVSDIIMTKFFSSEEIANWAELRSLIGISGILCLIGLDQVLMRSPQSSGRILRLLAVQVPVLAAAVGSLVYYVGYIDDWVSAFAIAVGSAFTIALSQYFRSHHLPVESQVVQQLWKILAFAALVLIVFTKAPMEVDVVVTSLLLVGVGCGVFLVYGRPPSRLHQQDPEPTPALYAIGSRFMVTSLFLASAVYAEQLLVNGLGSALDGALYFAHATYFLFPASALNGYLGFLVGPWIRDHHDRFIDILRKRAWLILLAAIGYAVSMNSVGWLGWHLISPTVGAIDHTLQGLFLCTCVATTLYTFPSAYNGVFGQPHQHDFLIAVQVVSLLAALCMFLFLFTLVDISLIRSVAIASALNWGLRTAAGFWVIHIIAASRR